MAKEMRSTIAKTTQSGVEKLADVIVDILHVELSNYSLDKIRKNCFMISVKTNQNKTKSSNHFKDCVICLLNMLKRKSVLFDVL